MATHPKNRIDESGTIYRPVYAQLPIPVFELLREMKFKKQLTYSELIRDALLLAYSDEADSPPSGADMDA